MNDKSLKPSFYSNKAFDQSENDLNNNQVKAIQITESIELKSKEVEHVDFVYKEGGYGWVVGLKFFFVLSIKKILILNMLN